MTETKSHHYYVVDERLKDTFDNEDSEVLEKIIFTNRRENIWYGCNPLPSTVHQISITKAETKYKLATMNQDQNLRVQTYECFCTVCMSIDEGYCNSQQFVQPSTYFAKRVQPAAVAKEYNPYKFLGQGVAQDPTKCAVVAIETKPNTIRYAEMEMAPYLSSHQGRDNIECPLEVGQKYTIPAKTEYVKLRWLEESHDDTDEVSSNSEITSDNENSSSLSSSSSSSLSSSSSSSSSLSSSSLSSFSSSTSSCNPPPLKKYKILPLVGSNAEERKQNQLFPANRILVPTWYCDRKEIVNAQERLDYLGMTRIHDTEGPGSSAGGGKGGGGYYYEQDTRKMATEDLRTVKALTIKDPEENNDDCDDME